MLSACYDYEVGESDKDLSESGLAESMAYLKRSEHDEEDGVNDFRLYTSTMGSFEYSEINGDDRHAHAGYRNRKQTVLARNRHRRRRYDVLSKLLLSSAELLELEKGQTRAFLPMLSKLLVPHHNDGGSKSRRQPPLRASSRDSDPMDQVGDSVYSASVHSFSEGNGANFIDEQIDRIEFLRPFLESMTPGAGFRCLSMFLMQHLLHSQVGYDARVRHAVKTLGVFLLVHDMLQDPVDILSDMPEGRSSRARSRKSQLELVALATRKFEALESTIATKLLHLSQDQDKISALSGRSSRRPSHTTRTVSQQPSGLTKEQILRGLKIGGTAVVAGTLFAVTGGLAAPGIAAGVAALAGGTAATAAAAAVLTSTAAVTAIFGVGGGSLAAYKMQRRTQGLTEFEFRREGVASAGSTAKQTNGQLFSTIVISGWLCDECDFQRPWGVNPTNPRISDRLELLERFYYVHSPDHVPKCRRILQSWQGEETQLWNLLQEKYEKSPNHLFPLAEGPKFEGRLTLEQEEVIELLFVELGYARERRTTLAQTTPFERMRLGWKKRNDGLLPAAGGHRKPTMDSLHGPRLPEMYNPNDTGCSSVASSGFDSVSTSVTAHSDGGLADTPSDKVLPRHLSTVWDYEANFGGDLYTVKWESDLLMELCDSVSDLAFDVVSGGTAQLLKHTALSTLMSAIAWPYALVNAANMIDGTWTLAVERADEAGRELARSLLFSGAGHRPVTLVGFSFGARTIYACLKELARYQEKWENYQEGDMPLDIDPEFETYKSWRRFYKNMREPSSIVEDAVLMGLPNHLSVSSWKACRRVVAGRLVNCFSQRDLILSLMFQFKRLGLKPVCGTCPVNVPGVENFDVSDLVSGHQDYCLITGDILKRVRHAQPFISRGTRIELSVSTVGMKPTEARVAYLQRSSQP